MKSRKSKIQAAQKVERSQTMGARPAGPCFCVPELPAHFAERLLQAELELETNCCIPLVNELMELYQQAIEYYEHKGDSKFIDLQQRMHKTLLRSDVLLVLTQSKTTAHTPSKPHPKPNLPLVASAEKMPEIPQFLGVANTQDLIRKKKEEASLALRRHQTDLPKHMDSMSVSVQVSRSLNKLFESHETSTRTVSSQVHKDKERQDQQLKERLQARVRSRASSRKNSLGPETREKPSLGIPYLDMSLVALRLDQMPSDQQSPVYPSRTIFSAQLSPRAASTSDSSEAGEIRIQVFDDLEKRLEEVMERNYAAKAAKTAEIRSKYQRDLADMEKEGPASGLVLQVMEKTKTIMEQEVEAAMKVLDQMRKEEVQQLRVQYSVQ